MNFGSVTPCTQCTCVQSDHDALMDKFRDNNQSAKIIVLRSKTPVWDAGPFHFICIIIGVSVALQDLHSIYIK